MAATESGTYRVLPGPDEDTLRLLERYSEEPLTVRVDAGTAAKELQPGHVVEATLTWPPEGEPELAAVTVVTETLFEFVDDADHVFEKATETFEDGRRERTPVASTVTYDTDGQANGVLYTITRQADTDLFAAFRDGRRTLEPMVEKLRDGGSEPPHELFVIRPVDEEFLVVYLAIEKGGLLADTVREEFDCPRP